MYQHRYVQYARAHGLDPDAMLERDRKAWPGGCMTGFIVWIGEQWRAWAAPGRIPEVLTDAHHAAFDRWLETVNCVID